MFKKMKATFAPLLATIACVLALGMPSAANAIPLVGSYKIQYESDVTGFTQACATSSLDCLTGAELSGYFGTEAEFTTEPRTRVLAVDLVSRPDLVAFFTATFGNADNFFWAANGPGAGLSGIAFALSTTGEMKLEAFAKANYAGPAVFTDLNPPVTHPVPEPETYALMLAGLMTISFVGRCKKTVAPRG